MDDFSEEDSVDRGVGRDPSEYDIEKEVNEDHQEGQAKRKRKLTSQICDDRSNEFKSQECTVGAQKTQLELYLDEPRIDVKSKLDVFNF